MIIIINTTNISTVNTFSYFFAIGSDNKFRILKNGGVHAVLVAMSGFPDEESVNINALKVLSNLLESGKW